MALCYLWLEPIILGTASFKDVDQLLRVSDDEVELEELGFDLHPALFLVAFELFGVLVLGL